MPTLTQTARLRGWDAQKAHRGVSLILQPSGPTLVGVIEPVEPETSEFDLAQETRDASVITFAKSDLGSTSIDINSTFKDSAGVYYRVARLLPRHSDVLVKYICEAVNR